MNSERELLALRKDVLVARSSMLRLKAASELQSLLHGLTGREVAGSIAASPKARSAIFASLLLFAGSRRMGRLLRMAAVALAVAKAGAIAARFVRRAEARESVPPELAD